jgi:NAD(P)H-nitrite reductase large subunit
MKVFIAGPRAISVLDKSVEKRLSNIHSNDYTVLVGDASGVDNAVQKFFSNLSYQNVVVYASEGKARNNAGNWEIRKIDVPVLSKGFNYYAAKDKAMADDADYGFMIWNGESKGTLSNIINLLEFGKKSIVYLTRNNTFYDVGGIDELQNLISLCERKTQALFERLNRGRMTNIYRQVSLF